MIDDIINYQLNLAKKLQLYDINSIEKQVNELKSTIHKNCKIIMTNDEYYKIISQTMLENSAFDKNFDYFAAQVYTYNKFFTQNGRKTTFSHVIDVNFALNDEYRVLVTSYGEQIEQYIKYDRNYEFDSFGLECVLKYLLNDECPQQMYMRIALSIFSNNIEKVFQHYDLLSTKMISNASPTMYNAGLKFQQLSSCFQMSAGDSIESMYDTLEKMAIITKFTGGISIWLHNIRAFGASIANNKQASGLTQYIEVINSTKKHVSQNRGRPGAIAVYISCDHADVIDIINLKQPHGKAQDLTYCLWVSDLFMRKLDEYIRGENSGEWYLFDPKIAPNLAYVYGDEYEKLYNEYVKNEKYNKKVYVYDIMKTIYEVWSKKGGFYFMFKDACNKKSNLQNVGPICSSNLCTEILIPSWSEHDVKDFKKFNSENTAGEFGVCNLCSLNLSNYVINGEINYELLIKNTEFVCEILNNIIDITYNPTPECERSNKRHRPIGIGIMGLADMLAKLHIAYNSEQSYKISRNVISAIYYGALKKSIKLAREKGSYSSFLGSPMNKGILQPDMWANMKNWEDTLENGITHKMWDELRVELRNGYLRNSYLIACMPTASTANVVGVNESFEPFTANLYTRNGIFGQFYIRNEYLIADLKKIGMWNKRVQQQLIENDGSIQQIGGIPQEIKDLYKTSRENGPDTILKMSCAIGPFVCQSMSTNIFLYEPDMKILLRYLIDSWRAGIKTPIYYCHIQPKIGADMKSNEYVCHGCS